MASRSTGASGPAASALFPAGATCAEEGGWAVDCGLPDGAWWQPNAESEATSGMPAMARRWALFILQPLPGSHERPAGFVGAISASLHLVDEALPKSVSRSPRVGQAAGTLLRAFRHGTTAASSMGRARRAVDLEPLRRARPGPGLSARAPKLQATGCVVRRSARLWCWGENSAGLVGAPPAAGRIGPVEVPGLDGVVQAGVGSLACALLRDGRVFCWGPPYGHDPQRVL